MIPALRHAFNAAWRPEAYARLIGSLEARAGGPIEFPIAETPCFFPRDLIDRLAAIGRELIAQAMSGDAAAAAVRAVPAQFRGAASEPHPTFVQVDFGLVRGDDGAIEPRLVELQAFPSLYGFQTMLADAYGEAFSLDEDLETYVDGLTHESYRALLQQALTAGHDPSEVVLLEIAPHAQKTRPDFAFTEQIWGVRTVDTRELIVEGRRLFYSRDGVKTPIRRIYNRVIPDELVRKDVRLAFEYRDALDVEWAGHPEWYFRVSKFSIPWLRHSCVPRTWFLHEVHDLPLPRESLLLKPLFSFAGGGIVFAPSDEQLQAIAAPQRDQYILQERVTFAPVIETPDGPTQAEIRMMYVWTDELRAVLPLVRMGRGKMMGVDHNKGLRWVGASAALMVVEEQLRT